MGVKVPTQDNLRTSLAGGNTPTFRDPGFSETASLVGKQDQALGQQIEKSATQAAGIAIDIQEQANQLRVNDAVNKMRERAMKLTYDPAEGYMNLKGNAALDRPDGTALPDEYGGKLGQTVSEIAAGLANDAQRQAFALRAGDFETSFKGDVQQHMLGEYRAYGASVADGEFKLSVQDAKLNWMNPDRIDAAINGIKNPADPNGPRFGGVRQSIYNKAQVTGMSAAEQEAAMNEAESAVHSMVIQSALTNGNVTYANGYLEKNKEKMTAGDILKVQGQVSQKMDAFSAVTATSQTAAEYQGAFNPNDMDRLTNIVMDNESNGRRYEKDGVTPLTSPAGAKGEMQVMDGTNLDPGFGVKPAQDDSLDERARVGRDYIAAMVKRYADPAKALAAYNAGPGTVDNAIKAATAAGTPAAWMAYMGQFQSAEKEKETRDYVEKGMKKFGTGSGGTVPLPTEVEFVNSAIAKLGEAPRMETVEATRTQASAQYKLLVDARKQRGDAALEAAQKELIENGGNFNQLSPATLSNLSRYDPAKYDDAIKFAKAISADNVTTNMEAYSLAVQHPDELAAMSEPTFQQFLRTNFDKSDQEKIVTMRAGYITGTNDDSAKAINNDLLNQTINNRLKSLEINPTPKATDTAEAARIGAIQKFIRDDIYKQQEAIGRKLNPKELEERVDMLFGKSVELPGVLWGTNNEKLITMTFSDIPNPMRVALRNEFKARGVVNPTDEDILQAYWRYTTKGGQNGG